MYDILGREILLGDLIVTSRSSAKSVVLDINAFAIAIGKKQAYNGKVFTFGHALLIEHPGALDMQIKENLKQSYSIYITNKIQSEEEQKEQAKQKRLRVTGSSGPRVGDMYNIDNVYMYVYLGVCEVKSKYRNAKVGHTYIAIPLFPLHGTTYDGDSVNYMSYLEAHETISFKELFTKWLILENRDAIIEKNTDFYLADVENEEIYMSKKQSTKFINPVFHVNIVDWNVNDVKSFVAHDFNYEPRNTVVGEVKRIG